MCCNKFVLQLFFTGPKHNCNLAFQRFGCQVDPQGQHPTKQITPAVLLPRYCLFLPSGSGGGGGLVVVGGDSHEEPRTQLECAHFTFALVNGPYSRHYSQPTLKRADHTPWQAAVSTLTFHEHGCGDFDFSPPLSSLQSPVSSTTTTTIAIESRGL
jgi:hypothetical protein